MNFKYLSLLNRFIKTQALPLFLVGLFVIVLLVINSLLHGNQQIVVFDFKITYATFLHEASLQHLSKENTALLAAKFPKAVTMAVNDYSQKHQVVILVKNAVLAGGKDVTDAIQALIAKNMQKLSSVKVGAND